MPLDFNNLFLQQKIVKQADEQYKNVYPDDFTRRREGAKAITEVLKKASAENK